MKYLINSEKQTCSRVSLSLSLLTVTDCIKREYARHNLTDIYQAVNRVEVGEGGREMYI